MEHNEKRIAYENDDPDFNLIIKQFGYPVSQKKFLLLLYIKIFII
jgi:hypothetical protein